MGRTVGWVVFGAVVFAGCISAATAQETSSRCGSHASDLTELIACLKSAQGQTDAVGPKGCDRTPAAILAPAAGQRALNFGKRMCLGIPSKGTVIESTPGAPVSAPAAGLVLFAGEWRSYGALVIIDAGCSAEVLLSGVAALTITAGDQVERGGLIGKVAAPADRLPMVYFEVRQNNKPVDPD